MKKQTPATAVSDQVCPTGYGTKQRTRQPYAKDFYADSAPLRIQRKISYIPGEKPRDQLPEIPRLFIRGLVGGSIKIDLRGLGIDLSETAFAVWVADESLQGLHIHRGDIAIIDPSRPLLRTGDLILLGLNGREVLRRLTKRKRIWFFETVNRGKSESTPLLDHPVYGVVLGSFRLFTKTRAVKYPMTDASCMPLREWSISGSETRKRPDKAIARASARRVRHSTSKKSPFLLAGEKSPEYRPVRHERKSP